MPEWRRIALAFTILIMLVPVVAVAAPEALPSFLTAWMGETDKRVLALEQAVTELQNSTSLSEATSPEDSPVFTAAAFDNTDTDDTNTDDTTTTIASTTTTLATTTTTHTPTTAKAPAATTQPPTTQPPAQSPVGGELTGSVCGEVTSDATLKGNVSLCGDLTVMGAGTTLFARSGVNVEGNGHQIAFVKGANADFQGTKTSTWSGSGSNANVTRDINFNNMRRIMFMDGAGPSTLRYFAVNNSGTSALGDYSIHFHHNGNSTRGTLVEGVAVVGSRNHAFVPHASHGITFRDTIAKNGKCEAYWWDPPEFQSTDQSNNSVDILYDHALADGVTNCAGDNRGFRLAAFELGAGKGNVVRNSVARNVKPSHPKDCSGFKWPELNNKQPSSWTFTNNASYGSQCNGVFVWQNDSEDHIVNGFKGDGIDHGAYTNRYDYRNVDVSFLEVHAAGFTVTGGQIDVVYAKKHRNETTPTATFTNVSIGRFVVQNAGDDGTIPGTYVLNGTGLTCASIEYPNAVSGTRVVIDGTDCPSP